MLSQNRKIKTDSNTILFILDFQNAIYKYLKKRNQSITSWNLF